MFKWPGGVSSPDSIRHGRRFYGLIIAIAAFIVFAGTLTQDFVWDDKHIVYETRKVVEEEGPVGLTTVPFIAARDDASGTSGYYRPVSLISMWINDPAGLPSPFPYHVVNVLLHVINSLLVFCLLGMIIPDSPGPFLGSLVFAVHPVHAESVAFIAGRTDLLAAFFTLVTVIFWQRSRRHRRFPDVLSYSLGLASFTLACLAKEVAFLLPIVVVLWALADRHPSGSPSRKGVTPDMVWVMGLFVVLGLVVTLRKVLLGIGMGPGWSSCALWNDATLLTMAGEAVKNLVIYLRLLFFPWPLSVYYPPVPPETTALNLAAASGFVILSLVLAGKRHRRVGYVALSWIVLFLLPVSGIVGLGMAVIAERFCYLPSVGFVLVVGYTLGLGFKKVPVKSVYGILVGLLVFLLGAGSVLHAARWKDDVTFFRHAVESGPVSVPNMHFNLGNAYVEAGDLRSGIRAFEEAIRLNPLYIGAMLNLSSTYTRLHEHGKSLEILSRAGDLAPGDPRIWSNKGVALEMLGRTEEALYAYERASRLNPDDAKSSNHRGNLLYRLERYGESAGSYRDALAAEPGHLGALVGLGRSLEGLNRFQEAQEMFLNAAKLHPRDPAPYRGLGRVLLEQGKAIEAIVVYRKALESAGPEAGLHRGLVLAYHQAGRDEDARKHIRGLAGTDPGLSRQLDDLIDGLAGQGPGNRDPS